MPRALSFRVQEFSHAPLRLGCPRQNLTRRISWLGERDRLGRRGWRLADRIPPLLYNFYRGLQVQNELFVGRLFPKNLIWASYKCLTIRDVTGVATFQSSYTDSYQNEGSIPLGAASGPARKCPNSGAELLLRQNSSLTSGPKEWAARQHCPPTTPVRNLAIVMRNLVLSFGQSFRQIVCIRRVFRQSSGRG